MDPDAALDGIRRLVEQSDQRRPHDDGMLGARLEDLAVRVQALDEWLSQGGFLPTAWTNRGEQR